MINEENILLQEKELAAYSDDVEMVRRKIRRYKDDMSSVWRAREFESLNIALNDMEYRLRKISTEIDEIRHEILTVYQKKQEESVVESE